MDLLTIQHEDFTMYVECTKFDVIWNKARGNVGEENLLSTYTWSEGVVEVKRNDVPIAKGEKAPAVFFDNAEYPVWVDFNKDVTDAQFGSMLQSDNDRFTFRKRTLAGFINYGNDIGKSELNLVYQIGKETKRFTFGYEVLSTKLNYHEHWRKIIDDIEQEYRMLSLDYMKRTFHGFTPDTTGETPELIWWSVFAEEQQKFIKACRSIIERPRHRLHGYEVYLRADKLKRVPANIENELAEHRKETAHLYRVEEQIQSNDTQENRFLKYALGQITRKYESLKERIVSINGLAENKKKELSEIQASLNHLQRNPFFRTVGRFKGLNQESLVLQRATGYSQVYTTWNLLRRAYSLNDGVYRLQSKDIATLYEIWCFIEVSHIVREQLGISKEDVDHRNRMEMNCVFTWELGKGEHSRILFRKDGVELAELVYNPKHSDKDDEYISMPNMYVPTVPQKPDIVLQLTKDDMQKGMKMTYLFDAKYRIDGNVNGVDTPPNDAINQMHRYRDAIYYKNYDGSQLKKEVIGGYILFPGDGEPLKVAKARFQKSLNEVNIGAFPLRPKDEDNRKLLEKFIQELIETNTSGLLRETIPQKGLYYQEGDPVYLMIPARNQYNIGIIEDLKEGRPCLFCCSHNGIREDIDIRNVQYLVPLIEGDFYGYYEVKSVNTRVFEGSKDPLRIEFVLDDYKDFGHVVKSEVRDSKGVPLNYTELMKLCGAGKD